MKHRYQAQLIQFLQTELSVPASAINTALRQYHSTHAPLPMVLWHYGLITLDQLDRTFDWLESA
ncbi:hypothetical protein C1752_01072 [Acaryochloris thomasi RCC1774]|uniref:DUF2949 domain-containing protein n=1 Tax=Acaryochloris thomasi RCC1774 TaxID=1764569 RepID=A0A2W1JNP7_9CYAN|nr:DUF2949 domain-containing protein [Acaryochloris thomasi]PZD74953.1 hypothetical protein C1752_01072 [Acaryochloris thomasi RCC1774]